MGVFISSEGSKSYKPAPAGNHVAVCIGVYDIGTQETDYGPKRQIRLTWELTEELMDDGRPFVMGKVYTTSLNEKARLRADLEAWRGRPFTEAEMKRFDVAALLGKACLLNVVHKPSQDGSKTYANIKSISPLMKGMKAPEPQNPLIQFSIDECDGRFPEGMPEFIQKKVAESPEWKRLVNPAAHAVETVPQADPADEDDDDIPF